jgi:D-alanyl-lipoteichoic acid acyltransferase DltB (MBOAT superfamily)
VSLDSWPFLFLLAGGFVVFWMMPTALLRKMVLIGLSGAFISSYFQHWSDGVGIAVYGAAIICAAYLVASRPGPRILGVSLMLLVVGLLWAKRYFLLVVLPPPPEAMVTVGISYMLFRAIQLICDLYDGTIEKERLRIPDLFLFLFSFLSFSAGPIQRYDDFQEQADSFAQLSPRKLGWEAIISRISVGYFKLIVVAPLLLALQGRMVPAAGQSVSALAAGSILFTTYVYVNFSAYMDVVIGAARLFGLSLPENFNHPFLAKSYLDFWNRWHITLSKNFQTYVFYPLVRFLTSVLPGRNSIVPGVLGYFVVFFLLGLWHGNTACFAVFGLLLALGAAVNKAFEIWCQRSTHGKQLTAHLDSAWSVLLSRALAIAWFSIAAVPAWTQISTLKDLASVYRFGHPGHLLGAFLALVIGVIATQAVALCLGVLFGVRHLPAANLLQSRFGVGFAIAITLWFAAQVNQPASTLVFYQRF